MLGHSGDTRVQKYIPNFYIKGGLYISFLCKLINGVSVLLQESKEPSHKGINMSKTWAESLLRRVGFRWRVVTSSNPTGIYLLKVNNRNTKTRCEICSRLTIKTPKRRQSF